jgi:hypothetical protein
MSVDLLDSTYFAGPNPSGDMGYIALGLQIYPAVGVHADTGVIMTIIES